MEICRICLVKDVRMYAVVNKNLHQLYEKLTDVPFVTEDSRPMLACFFCCAKLKQCWRFQRKCLEAEELFTQMMNENYEPNHLMNLENLYYIHGFSHSPIELISIVDVGQTESDAIKEELPDVRKRLGDIIDLEKDYQSYKLDPDNTIDNSHLEVENKLVQHMESDSEYEVPLIEMKTEVVDEQESIEKKLDTVIPDMSPNVKDLPAQHVVLASKYEVPVKIKIEVVDEEELMEARVGEKTPSRNEDTTEKPYKCNICLRSFTQKGNLGTHTRIHTGEKPFKCHICQRSFIQKIHLTSHIATHTEDKPFKCRTCQRHFKHKKYLMSHIRTHTGEKPYKCDFCKSSFNQKMHLTTHIRRHTGEKPFKCDVCQRVFAKKSDLVSHMRTHTGEQPYRCDICQRWFKYHSNLVSHIRTHSGQKPFKCDICQRSFTKRKYLLSHTQTHTGGKPSKS